MKTNFETPKDHMEESRIDYVVILVVVLYWLGAILHVILNYQEVVIRRFVAEQPSFINLKGYAKSITFHWEGQV